MPVYDDPLMRDPDNPSSKGGGGGYVPPGGGGIGPGGGFGGGFGGSGFFGAGQGAPSGGFFGINTVRPRRKIVQGPSGPVSVSYSPMVADSVPAMLSPGEGVLNNGAMAEPGMEGFLNAANQRGVQRMADGGMVPGGMGGGMMGGSNSDEVLEVLRLLLPLLLGRGQAEQPEVQGFAWGGQVRPQYGGFSAPSPMAPTGPRTPAQQVSYGGQAGRPQAAPTGFWGGVRQLHGAPPAGGPTMQPGGQTTGPSTTPTNPWGSDPFAPGSENPGDEWNARMQEMLKQFGNFGSFSPEGSAGVMQAVSREATSNADALRRRAATQADLSGLDPGQRASYAMQTDLNTQGDVANILSNAQREQLLGQQQFGQNMLGKMTDAQMQAWLARLASWMKGG